MQVPDDTYNLDQARLIEEAILNVNWDLKGFYWQTQVNIQDVLQKTDF